MKFLFLYSEAGYHYTHIWVSVYINTITQLPLGDGPSRARLST